MKKRLFIGVLPMLMALSACGGAGPNAAAKEEGTFLEDTLAHEEIFGSLDDPSSPIKSIRNLDPTDPSTPAIGVQYYEEYNTSGADPVLQYVSVRYVAAVRIENPALASAKWNRTIYNANGTIHHDTASVECEHKYTVIYDGGSDSSGSLSIEEYNSSHGTNYNYFFMYALRRVPAGELGGALCSSFTFNNGAGSVTTTRVVATTLNTRTNSVCAAFDSTDFAAYGYFLKGDIDTGSAAVLPQDDNLVGLRSNIASFSTNLNLAEGNNFVVAWSDHVDPEDDESPLGFKLLNPSLSGDTATTAFTKTGAKFSLKTGQANQYALYLTSTGELMVDKVRNITFRVKASSSQNMYITGGFNQWNESPAAYLMNEIDTTNHIYAKTIAIPTGEQAYKFTYHNGEYQVYEGDCEDRKIAETGSATTDVLLFNREGDIYPPLPKEETNLYLTNSRGWTAIKIYAWNASTGDKMSEWEGDLMTWSHKNPQQQDVWVFENFDLSAYDRIIFNGYNGSTFEKTVDIDVSVLGVNGFWIKSSKYGDAFKVGYWSYNG